MSRPTIKLVCSVCGAEWQDGHSCLNTSTLQDAAIYSMDTVLHILRNPYGKSEDTVRTARLVACQMLEVLRDKEPLAYTEKHFQGHLFLENVCFLQGECDLGIKIAEDGRIWICVNGISLLRFKPSVTEN